MRFTAIKARPGPHLEDQNRVNHVENSPSAIYTDIKCAIPEPTSLEDQNRVNHVENSPSAIYSDRALPEPKPLEELNHVNHIDHCLSAIYKDTPQEIKIKGTNAFSQMYPDILDLNDPTITPLFKEKRKQSVKQKCTVV